VNKDILQEIWDKGRKEPQMTKAEIQAILQPRIRKSALGWHIVMWTYLAVIAGTLVCEGMNIYAFRTNPIMLTVGVLLTFLTLGFLAYGIHIVRELATIDQADESLVAKLQRRLRFHRTKCEIWLWMIALTTAFLSFAVSTMVDAQDGQYRINRPGVFIGITLGQILFMYAALKIGHYPFVRESKAILSDLENQVTTGTDKIRAFKRTWRLWGLLLVSLLTILATWGLVKAIGWPG
jgi:hypothetical protein